MSSPTVSLFDSWFVDSKHAVLPVARERTCVDVFMNSASLAFSLATGAYGAYATVFDFGTAANPYHSAVAGIAFALLVWSRVGEWCLSDVSPQGRPIETYVFMVVQWWLAIAMMWAGIADYVQIRRATEYIEENWYILQTEVVIPFTTQIDSKRSLEANSRTLMGLSIVSSILALPLMIEAWKALGGKLQLIQRRYATLVPEVVPLFVLGGATLAYTVYGGEIAIYSSPFGSDALLWLGGMTGVALLAICALVAATVMWGVTFLAHAAASALLVIPTFVVFVTSLINVSRAQTIDNFVLSNWETLRLFVPPKYSLLSWKKYAEASASPTAQAGSIGLVLSVVLLFSIFFHAQAAVAVLSIGPELSTARIRYERRRGFLLSVARGEMTAEAAADADRVAEGIVSTEARSSKSPSPRRIYRSSSLRNPNFGLGGMGGLASLGGPSYGSVPADDPAASTLLPGEVESGMAEQVDLSSSSMLSTFRSNSARSHGYGEKVSDASHIAKSQIEQRLSAIADLSALEKSSDLEMRELGARVKSPDLSTLVRTLDHDTRTAYGRNRRCFVISAVFASVFVGLLSGGLAKVGYDGACEELASNLTLVTATYNTSFPLLLNNDAVEFASSLVTIVNHYGKGSVEIFNEHVDPNVQDSQRIVTFALTFFATKASDLPSMSSALSAVTAQGFTIPADPSLPSGYANLNVTLSPPDKSSSCLGVRIVVTTNSYLVRLSVTSDSAAVIVHGNANDINVNQPGILQGFTRVSISTNAAPVLLDAVWADYLSFYPNFFISRLHPDPSVTISTGVGDVFVNKFFGAGLSVVTGGGNIRATSIFCFCVFDSVVNGNLNSCGDVNFLAGGFGRSVVSQAFAAYSASVRSTYGEVVIANSGMLVAEDLVVSSDTGTVLLSNMIQATGNNTYVTTKGKVSASAVFCNRIVIDVGPGFNGVSIAELFAGINISGGEEIFAPSIKGRKYSVPDVRVTTDLGDITVLGIGGNPAAAAFANLVSLHFSTIDGKIRMEVNGGGINANYSVSAVSGAVVEIDGESQPLKGEFGVNPFGTNEIVLFSEKDTIQLTLLDSVY